MRAPTTGVVVAAAGLLCGAGVAQAAATATSRSSQDDEPESSKSTAGPHVGLLVIDNSSADSWLEVDRTLNTLVGGKGTAGSDHDGGGGAVDVRTGDVSGSGPDAAGGWIGQLGHPPERAGNGD
ncbi:hypothetical protein [Streptomyces sp. AK02-01A]|uniref:hypothetical protein n=1 Tax=Streptomyces sp. AK02-01A TaxID=3028648 RepID=UPI0029A1915F|nr:hypothetical protein [Streptomyces sp. AK02-01A]MDX3854135.1 hypothetical protein [Streptomyces sp. AK02-01A]